LGLPVASAPPNAALHSPGMPGSGGKCCNLVVHILLKGFFPPFKRKKPTKTHRKSNDHAVKPSHCSISFPSPTSHCPPSSPVAANSECVFPGFVPRIGMKQTQQRPPLQDLSLRQQDKPMERRECSGQLGGVSGERHSSG